jgi:hypothetical protein
LSTLSDQVAGFFGSNGLTGCTYGQFSTVSWWATNSLYTWAGTYWCYLPDTANGGFIIPDSPCGTLTVSNGEVSYLPTPGTTPVGSLSFSQGLLSSPGATANSGFYARSLPRSLVWEGQSNQLVLCFVGSLNGQALMAQPYQNPALPWPIGAYDLAYGAFQIVQLGMALDMAIHLLAAAGKGLSTLSANIQQLITSLNNKLNTASQEADSVAATAGDEIETVNVDVDVDVDVDIDTDTETVENTDTDTDVDVDIDIDIDIDDDVFAVIDVDVDVDVDIDTDVVTDTETVIHTDTVTDVDTDIDTDVNVEPGTVKSLLNGIGTWIMEKGFPALVTNVGITVTMISAQKLLQLWHDQEEQDVQNLQPAQSTGLGLLINYMLNESDPKRAWATYADYVRQTEPDLVSQQLLLTMIMMTKDTAADNALSSWSWPENNKTAIVGQMAKFHTPSNYYLAYGMLGYATYRNQPLPVKVAGGVAMSYLKALIDPAQAKPSSDWSSFMAAGDSLTANQVLMSPDASHYLIYEPNGNVEVFNNWLGWLIWCTDTEGAVPTGQFAFQEDGNICLLDANGKCWWSSNTQGTADLTTLNMESNGTLCAFNRTGSYWQSSDPDLRVPPSVLPHLFAMYPGDRIWRGRIILAPDGSHYLTVLSDGNVVVCDNNSGTVIWQSNTSSSNGAYLEFGTDGYLRVFAFDSMQSSNVQCLWTTGNPATPTLLMVEPDGTLCAYDSSGCYWKSQPDAS